MKTLHNSKKKQQAEGEVRQDQIEGGLVIKDYIILSIVFALVPFDFFCEFFDAQEKSKGYFFGYRNIHHFTYHLFQWTKYLTVAIYVLWRSKMPSNGLIKSIDAKFACYLIFMSLIRLISIPLDPFNPTVQKYMPFSEYIFRTDYDDFNKLVYYLIIAIAAIIAILLSTFVFKRFKTLYVSLNEKLAKSIDDLEKEKRVSVSLIKHSNTLKKYLYLEWTRVIKFVGEIPDDIKEREQKIKQEKKELITKITE